MRYARVTDSLARHGSAKWAVHDRAKALRAAGRPVILLTIGEPDLPPSPQLIGALAASLAAGRTGYSSGRGEAPLLAALARKYTARSGRAIAPRAHRRLPRHPDRALRGDAHAGRGRATRCWSATRCMRPTRA